MATFADTELPKVYSNGGPVAKDVCVDEVDAECCFISFKIMHRRITLRLTRHPCDRCED